MLPKKVNPEENNEYHAPKRRTKTPAQALSALMRLCARAEKSEGDALRLMRGWGLGEEDAARVVAQLVQSRFIDNTRYAEAFVREKARLSGWGAYKISMALRRKGVDKTTTDRALAQITREEAASKLEERLRRKARTLKAATPYDLKTKLIRHGLSLGYDYETVRDTAETIIKESSDSCPETTFEEFF